MKLLPLLMCLHSVVLGQASVQTSANPEWPITFETAKGQLTIYQPQPESFNGDMISARAAIAVTLAGKTEPVFGAIWMDARVLTDRENRTVTILDITVPQVKFPEGTEGNMSALARFIETEMTKLELTFSLDALLTSLESAERQVAVDTTLRTDPPAIIVRSAPTVLVTIDGEPQLRAIDNSSILRAVNTPYVLLLDPGTKQYYLTDGQMWFSAGAVTGPWSVNSAVPKEVRLLAPPDTGEGTPAAPSGPPPDIVVATVPTELIVTDGAASYEPISGTDLLTVTNTESDIFLDVSTQKHYILLSGRWYAGTSLQGPWSFVASDKLPSDFAKLPPDSKYGDVLTFVAGTDQAKDAVLDASIPQTSAISRSDTSLIVVYDGEPRFVDIEGTQLKYAVNTEFSVLQAEGRFYCCNEAVWYESPTPRGPWTVAVDIPRAVYEQPPSAPTYNTKYVYVYHYTPTVVYVGYLPGYTGCYVYGPTIVYGTGYYYPPYVGPVYYYPRPVTYGFRVSYNPYTGWGFGFSYSVGFVTFGMNWHSRYYPRPPYGGAYYRPPYHGYWGPGGYRPTPYDARTRTRTRESMRSANGNIYDRSGNATRNIGRSRPTRPAETPVARGGNNNVMTDRSGNVYRQDQKGSWQRRESTGWSKPSPSPSNRAPQQGAQNRTRQLERDRAAQQRGVQRGQSFDRQRQSATPRRGATPAPRVRRR